MTPSGARGVHRETESLELLVFALVLQNQLNSLHILCVKHRSRWVQIWATQPHSPCVRLTLWTIWVVEQSEAAVAFPLWWVRKTLLRPR